MFNVTLNFNLKIFKREIQLHHWSRRKTWKKHPNMAAHPGAGEASGPQSTAPGQGQGIQISKNVGKLFDCCIYCIFLFFGTDLDSLTCFNTHVGSPGIGRWAVSNPAPVGWCWSNWAPGARWRGSWPWCVAPSTAASGTGQTGWLWPWPWRIGETKMGYQNPGENA